MAAGRAPWRQLDTQEAPVWTTKIDNRAAEIAEESRRLGLHGQEWATWLTMLDQRLKDGDHDLAREDLGRVAAAKASQNPYVARITGWTEAVVTAELKERPLTYAEDHELRQKLRAEHRRLDQSGSPLAVVLGAQLGAEHPQRVKVTPDLFWGLAPYPTGLIPLAV